MGQPQLAVVVTTYERPWHLRRVLLSLAAQQGVEGGFEIVVADDGSTDETPDVVERFHRETGLPVRFVTHRHEGFCPAKSRNEGFAATTAPYVLFLDGDCVVPPDHLAIHLRYRRPGRAVTTDCVRLDPETTRRFSESAVSTGEFVQWVPHSERRRLRWAHYKAVLYHWLRHPTKPRVLSGNLAVWRADFERINGFDENYRGWGCEDDDLGLRLHRSGVRVISLRHRTWTFHLWHPRVPSAPTKVREGPNIPYFHRAGRLTRCRNGLWKRDWRDLNILFTGDRSAWTTLPLPEDFHLIAESSGCPPRWGPSPPPEVEILLYRPGQKFRSKAECRVLLIPPGVTPPPAVLRDADIIWAPLGFAPSKSEIKRGSRVFSHSEMSRFWEVLG